MTWKNTQTSIRSESLRELWRKKGTFYFSVIHPSVFTAGMPVFLTTRKPNPVPFVPVSGQSSNDYCGTFSGRIHGHGGIGIIQQACASIQHGSDTVVGSPRIVMEQEKLPHFSLYGQPRHSFQIRVAPTTAHVHLFRVSIRGHHT